MDYKQAVDYIEGIKKRGSVPGLSRIKRALHALGDPQDRLKVVHVAGTNGKGSFCLMLSKALERSGYRVGSFCSPYMTDRTDMYYCGGENIDKERFAEICERMIPVCETFSLTEYEFYTVLAFCYLDEEKPDIAIIECCMGGRLDATNVIKKPLLSVITSVDIDHTAFLGNSVESIASHKAGIIKKGCPALIGKMTKNAEQVIRRRAYRCKSRLFRTDFSKLIVTARSIEGSRFSYKDRADTFVSLAGAYQPYNAANALEACDILAGNGFVIPESAIKEAFAGLVFHGRFEVISKDPAIIYDGAHNLDGAKAFVRSVKEIFGNRKCILITGVMADKDYLSMAELMSGICEKVITVRPDNPRALDPSELAQVYKERGIPAGESAGLKEALENALESAKTTGSPVIAVGSLYMYKDFIYNFKNMT